jgi:hypothetical protein
MEVLEARRQQLKLERVRMLNSIIPSIMLCIKSTFDAIECEILFLNTHMCMSSLQGYAHGNI